MTRAIAALASRAVRQENQPPIYNLRFRFAILSEAMRRPLNYPPGVPIWIDPERLSGAPGFQGTRVPVDSLFTNLKSGLRLDEYLDGFPDVAREEAVAVLEYARKLTRQPAA